MHIGRRYRLRETLWWSRGAIVQPFLWALAVTALYELAGLHWLAIPWLPTSAIAIAVAFYLGFKNNASYDRLWEARKIWGAIVNASRSWAFSARDLVRAPDGARAADVDVHAVRRELVLRHVAWMDALRHQLRKLKSWEHHGPVFDRYRRGARVAEYEEDLGEVLGGTLDAEERDRVLSMINPAAHLLARQSERLGELRRDGLIDGFGLLVLQNLLIELMAQQGKAERIKNFPFPRQYATVNAFFAWLFAVLVPMGMLEAFGPPGSGRIWLTVPFATIVSWVFLTTDRIGDWSENPFEGLANDVPITSMARGIERDIRQMIGQTDLPPAREPTKMLLL
ncbi:MAG: bestrophin family protein [Sandaracinaceae bacterium]